MTKQFAVIGLGRFGTSIALELSEMGHEVLAIDSDEQRIDYISPNVTHALQLDSADEASLKSLGLRNFDAVIVAIGSDLRSSIMTCMLAREAGAPVVIAKSSDELHSKILYKLGVDKVVFPEHDMATRLAHTIASSNVIDFVKLSGDYNMSEIKIPEAFIGHSLSDLNVRAKYGLNVAAVRTSSGLTVAPQASYIFKKGDVMVALCSNADLKKFELKHLSDQQ